MCKCQLAEDHRRSFHCIHVIPVVYVVDVFGTFVKVILSVCDAVKAPVVDAIIVKV